MGEIIEESEQDGVKRKKVVRKSTRVPIDLMAAIQRGDLKGTNVYELGMMGTKAIVSVGGKGMEDYAPSRFYSDEETSRYLADIVKGRMKFTEEITAEGLDPDIVKAAEKSFGILPKR